MTQYRFTQADGRTCCASDEVEYLCPTCTARALTEIRDRAVAAVRNRALTGARSGSLAPEPPDLVARLRAASPDAQTHDRVRDLMRSQRSSVPGCAPAPPSLVDVIAASTRGAR